MTGSLHENRPDVVIIGGGAAGLQAAAVLAEQPLRVALLEARPRLGGRVLTLHEPDSPAPLDLGAELIHGDCPETRALLDPSEIDDVPNDHLVFDHGGLHPMGDLFETITEAAAQQGAEERPVSDLLDSIRANDPHLESIIRMFVEGFHAADPSKLTSLALSDGEEEGRQSRPRAGYDLLLQRLETQFRSRVAIRLSTAVRTVEWTPRRVRLRLLGEDVVPGELECSSLIVTVPLSILDEGMIRFDPSIPALEEICRRLHTGHVAKLLLRFHEPFWKDRLSGSFVHAPGAPFPTWWTMAPSEAPVLVAWTGGPGTPELNRHSMRDQVSLAVETLAEILGTSRSALEQQLVSSHHHDWSSDPWSRGAYSYPGVGGTEARKLLLNPIEETLFFAGEALSADYSGTVEGALETGRRAAEQVLEVHGSRQARAAR